MATMMPPLPDWQWSDHHRRPFELAAAAAGLPSVGDNHNQVLGGHGDYHYGNEGQDEEEYRDDDSQLLPPDAFQPACASAAARFVGFEVDKPEPLPPPPPCTACPRLERELARLRRDLDRTRRRAKELEASASSASATPPRMSQSRDRWDDDREALATRAAELEAANERLRADAELRERRLAIQSELLAAEGEGGEEAAWRPRLYRALVQAEAERWSQERRLRQAESAAAGVEAALRRQLAESEARAEAAERKLAAADRLAERLQADVRRLGEQRARELTATAEGLALARALSERTAADWLARLAEMEARMGRLVESTDQLAASEKLGQLATVSELHAAMAESRAALDAERQSRRQESGRLSAALDSANREQAKLTAALAQSERRLQREREAADERARQSAEDFRLAAERLRDRLRLAEGERNLLQATAAAAASAGSGSARPAPRPHSSADTDSAVAVAVVTDSDPRLHAAVRDLRQMLANSG